MDPSAFDNIILRADDSLQGRPLYYFTSGVKNKYSGQAGGVGDKRAQSWVKKSPPGYNTSTEYDCRRRWISFLVPWR